ncbi:MAG: hypothetical protein ACJAT1_001598 [Marivirga sp.]|jgi:hypothetical protein
MVKFKNKGLLLFFVTVISVAFVNDNYAQCINKEDVKLVMLDGNGLAVDFSLYKGTYNQMMITLYKYDNAIDYKVITLNQNNTKDVLFDEDSKKVYFQNVPKGDYLIIINNLSCDKIYLGEGFSGFPYSGLRFE